MPAPAAGFNPYAGSDGRLQTVAVTPDLTSGLPTIPTNPTRAAVAGVKSWKANVAVEKGTSRHFESPANAAGVVFPHQLQGGVGEWSVEIEGEYDADSAGNTSTKFFEGQFVVMDLIHSKTSTFGRYNARGKITRLGESKAEGSPPGTFSATIEGHGLLPPPSYPA